MTTATFESPEKLRQFCIWLDENIGTEFEYQVNREGGTVTVFDLNFREFVLVEKMVVKYGGRLD